MSINKKITIIIVNYNSTSKLQRLIKSLKFIRKFLYQIIIIDNNSNDFNNFKKTNEKIITINNSSNVGFAKAVNQGITLTKSDVIMLLNPDCELIDDSPLKSYKKILSNKKIGAIGGKILDTTTLERKYTATNKPGFLTALFEFTNLKKIFPHNKISNQFWIENRKNISKPIRVHSLCGAYMFFRKIPKIRFNEEYFLYMEDLDFGDVIKSMNLETWFDPRSAVTHIGGHSSQSKYKIVLRHWYRSRKLYFLKHLNPIWGYTLYILFTIEEYLLTIYHHFKNTPNE